MAKITISELENVSRESLLIDLNEYEQNGINGGGLWTLIKKVGKAVGEFVIDILD